MLVQVFLIGFAAYVLQKVYKQYRAEKVSAGWFILWTLFWVLVIVVALVPQATDALADIAGVGRGADLITYVSLAVLFFLMFRLIARVDQQQKDLTKLVRRLAIHQAEQEADPDSPTLP